MSPLCYIFGITQSVLSFIVNPYIMFIIVMKKFVMMPKISFMEVQYCGAYPKLWLIIEIWWLPKLAHY